MLYILARLDAGYVILRVVDWILLTGIAAAYQSLQRRRRPKTKFDAVIRDDRRIRTNKQCVAVGNGKPAAMAIIKELATESLRKRITENFTVEFKTFQINSLQNSSSAVRMAETSLREE
jgi:hypothetical protein